MPDHYGETPEFGLGSWNLQGFMKGARDEQLFDNPVLGAMEEMAAENLPWTASVGRGSITPDNSRTGLEVLASIQSYFESSSQKHQAEVLKDWGFETRRMPDGNYQARSKPTNKFRPVDLFNKDNDIEAGISNLDGEDINVGRVGGGEWRRLSSIYKELGVESAERMDPSGEMRTVLRIPDTTWKDLNKEGISINDIPYSVAEGYIPIAGIVYGGKVFRARRGFDHVMDMIDKIPTEKIPSKKLRMAADAGKWVGKQKVKGLRTGLAAATAIGLGFTAETGRQLLFEGEADSFRAISTGLAAAIGMFGGAAAAPAINQITKRLKMKETRTEDVIEEYDQVFLHNLLRTDPADPDAHKAMSALRGSKKDFDQSTNDAANDAWKGMLRTGIDDPYSSAAYYKLAQSLRGANFPRLPADVIDHNIRVATGGQTHHPLMRLEASAHTKQIDDIMQDRFDMPMDATSKRQAEETILMNWSRMTQEGASEVPPVPPQATGPAPPSAGTAAVEEAIRKGGGAYDNLLEIATDPGTYIGAGAAAPLDANLM